MKYPDKSFWEIFKETPGALSCAEAIAIYNLALRAPDGHLIELGTYRGKSAMSAAAAFKSGSIFSLVDPIFKDVEIVDEVSAALRKVAKDLYYCYTSITSIEALTPSLPETSMFSYVFVDSGSHSDELPMQESKLLEDRIVSGGILAYHDCFSQFTKVTEAYEYMLSTGKFDRIDIPWNEINQYVQENNLEEGNNSWHQYPELPHPPNFIGALKRK